MSTFCTPLLQHVSSLFYSDTRNQRQMHVSLYSQEPKKDLTPRTWYSRLHCNRPASLFTSTLQIEAVQSSKTVVSTDMPTNHQNPGSHLYIMFISSLIFFKHHTKVNT
jgi:hypothetical protein